MEKMMRKSSHDCIVVLDFGAQYSQLIARRVRELGVYSLILPFNATADEIRAQGRVKGIIFSGGPASVPQPDSPRPSQEIFEMGLPVLGICYGLQVMSHMLGGEVECPEHKEYGIANIDIMARSPLFKDVSAHSQVWMSHGDRVSRLPVGFTVTASTPSCPYTAVENREKSFYGVQFHPEVVHSLEGQKMISNFVLDICKAEADWNMGSFVNEAVEAIRAEVGDRNVLCGLSGGVDSSVAALLIHKAIGDQLVCVFVNNGMLRKGEAENVLSLFGKHFNINCSTLMQKRNSLMPSRERLILRTRGRQSESCSSIPSTMKPASAVTFPILHRERFILTSLKAKAPSAVRLQLSSRIIMSEACLKI